jgi:hypothetical protein
MAMIRRILGGPSLSVGAEWAAGVVYAPAEFSSGEQVGSLAAESTFAGTSASAGGASFTSTPAQSSFVATALPQASVAPSTVFFEVGAAAQQAAITRNGVQVPIVQLDPAALSAALGGTVALPARVVSQSVPPGVSIAKGASVDITLTEPAKLPVGVLKDAYQPLKDQTLQDIYTTYVQNNAAVQSVLSRNQDAASLSAADQGTLTGALGANNPVTNTPGETIDQAFSTLQAAFTFAG